MNRIEKELMLGINRLNEKLEASDHKPSLSHSNILSAKSVICYYLPRGFFKYTTNVRNLNNVLCSSSLLTCLWFKVIPRFVNSLIKSLVYSLLRSSGMRVV